MHTTRAGFFVCKLKKISNAKKSGDDDDDDEKKAKRKADNNNGNEAVVPRSEKRQAGMKQRGSEAPNKKARVGGLATRNGRPETQRNGAPGGKKKQQGAKRFPGKKK